MAMLNSFDELNNISLTEIAKSTKENLGIDEYFDGMDLEEDDKERRKEVAYNIYVILFYVFTLIRAVKVAEFEHNIDYYKEYLVERLNKLYTSYGLNTNRVQQLASEIIDTTMKHIDESDSYWFSDKRATIDAENETNIAFNGLVYEIAIDNGYKQKQWITKHDKRVRHTHEIIDFETIGINDFFEVGMCEMRFPCDIEYGTAKEIVNCRCTCKYF